MNTVKLVGATKSATHAYVTKTDHERDGAYSFPVGTVATVIETEHHPFLRATRVVIEIDGVKYNAGLHQIAAV